MPRVISVVPDVPIIIFLTASYIINNDVRIIRTPSIKPDISSYFPCPYGWSLSAGCEDFITEKNVNTEAAKSLSECIASDIILRLPEIIPTIIFNKVKITFDRIDKPATDFFILFICIFKNL